MDRRDFLASMSIPVAPMLPRQQLEKPKRVAEEVVGPKKPTQWLRFWTVGDGVEVKKEDMQNVIRVISGIVQQAKKGGDVDALLGGAVKCTAIPWGSGIDAVIGLTEDGDECIVINNLE